VAAPRTKAYGILSVAFQLYASNTATSTYGSSSSSTYSSSTFSSSSSSQNSPSMNAARRAEMLRFVIPSSVFFPRPKVDSALVHLDFTRPHK
jgi:16S rRNA A1518/A1519 N6-dimethyltransferase RsmA/KsgA/DIM1 with predicted DNA glycosylase/AP lyase activity